MQNEVNDMKIDSATNDILSRNKAIHADLLKTQCNRENIKVNEDGTISGIEEQFKVVKENIKINSKMMKI